MAGDKVVFKCRKCGFTWEEPLRGFLERGGKTIHWTEVKKAYEDALNLAYTLLNEGKSCEEVKNAIYERFSSILSQFEIAKVMLLSFKRYLEEVRYRDPKRHKEVQPCLEEWRRIWAKLREEEEAKALERLGLGQRP